MKSIDTAISDIWGGLLYTIPPYKFGFFSSRNFIPRLDEHKVHFNIFIHIPTLYSVKYLERPETIKL